MPDSSLILADPPLWMGELPDQWSDVDLPVVVNLCGVMPGGSPAPGQRVHVFPLLDVLDRDVLPTRIAVEKLVDVVHESIDARGSYWHCHAGLNRSGFAVAAYLVRHKGYRISTAIKHMRASRSPMVLCNSLFESTLRNWYGGKDEQTFEPVSFEQWLRERIGRREA